MAVRPSGEAASHGMVRSISHPGMNALAKEFEELALMASVLGRRPDMTPLDLLVAFSSLGI